MNKKQEKWTPAPGHEGCISAAEGLCFVKFPGVPCPECGDLTCDDGRPRCGWCQRMMERAQEE